MAGPGMLSRVLRGLSIPDDVVRLSSDTISYGIGKLGEGVAALVLIPVLTRAFAPAEFGIWDITMTFFLLSATTASLGLEPALAAVYFQTLDEDRKRLTASTSITFRLLSSMAVAVPIFILAPRISAIIFGTSEHAIYFRLIAGAIPFFLAANIFKQLLRLDFAPWRFNIVGAGYAVTYAGLAVFLVLRLKMGVGGVFVGILVSAVIFSLVGGVFAARHFSLQFSGQALKDMLAFGLPLMPLLFASWVIDFSDRYFLSRMASLEEVGIYSVGARISSMIILFSTSFQMAWGPFALSIQHEDDAKDRYSRGLMLYLCAALAGATGIVVFARPILVLLTQPKYYEAGRVIAPLVLSTVAYGAFQIANIGLIITRRIALSSVAIAAGAVLNVGLNFLLIPRFGMMGAAIATLISYLAAFALLYMFAQRHYPVDYRPGRLALLVLFSALLMIISSALRFESSAALDFIFRTLLLAGYLFFVLIFFLPKPVKN